MEALSSLTNKVYSTPSKVTKSISDFSRSKLPFYGFTFQNMKSTSKVVIITAVSLLAGGFANAALVSQFGILDLTANGGINPNTGVAWAAGDQYRLAFYTASKFDAVSSDPAVHNARVTGEANSSNLGNGAITTSTGWTAMITTTTTSVQDNTGTGDLSGGPGIGGAGFPVYAMDGRTAIARNNADIWNNWSNPFNSDAVIRLATGTTNLDSSGNLVTVPANQNVHYSPFLNQFGLGDSATIHGEQVWTGSNSNGAPLNSPTTADQRVGSVNGVELSVGNTNWGSSNANNPGRVWNRGNQSNSTFANSFYALSAPLTVTEAIPEPSTGLLCAIGGLFLVRRRRK